MVEMVVTQVKITIIKLYTWFIHFIVNNYIVYNDGWSEKRDTCLIVAITFFAFIDNLYIAKGGK